MSRNELAFAALFVLLSFSVFAEEKSVSGKIKKVDPDKKTLELGDLELDVTRKTRIVIDGKAATLADIKQGQEVIVKYDDSLDAAVEIIVGLKPKNGDEVNLSVVDPEKIKSKFKGKASFDEKSGELKIEYDFKNENQLEDFKFEAGAVKVDLGKMVIGATDGAQHKVEFVRVKVSGQFHPKKFNGKGMLLWFSGLSRLDYDINSKTKQFYLNCFSEGEQIGGGEFRPRLPLAIIYEVTERKAKLTYDKKEIGGKRKVERNAGRVHFAGGEEGSLVSKVVIEGVPDSEWLDALLKN